MAGHGMITRELFSAIAVLRNIGKYLSYLRHKALWNTFFVRWKPWSAMGRADGQEDKPFTSLVKQCCNNGGSNMHIYVDNDILMDIPKSLKNKRIMRDITVSSLTHKRVWTIWYQRPIPVSQLILSFSIPNFTLLGAPLQMSIHVPILS